MRKEIAVISAHWAFDENNGHNKSLELFGELSGKYDIRYIVPRWLDIYSDAPQRLGEHITVRSAATEEFSPQGKDEFLFDYLERISRSSQLREQLRAAAEGCELIVSNSLYYLPMLREVFPDKRIVYRCLDIEHDRFVWHAKHIDSAVEKHLGRAYEFEKAACDAADCIIPLTERDADRICGFYDIPREKIEGVIPICYSDARVARSFLPRQRPDDGRLRAVYIGHVPMDDEQGFLCAAGGLPEIEFHVVGRAGLLLKSPPENVIIHGVVSDADMQEIMQRCDFAINLTDMTYGMNVKVMDYFSMGVPVISNDLGMRGYHAEPYLHYFPCTPETFADDLRRFSEYNREKRYEMAVAAFRLLCERFDYSLYTEVFGRILPPDREQVYIFGAGVYGRQAVAHLRGEYDIIGFIDNNPDKQGSEIAGMRVFSPMEAFADINASHRGVIAAINNQGWLGEALKQLCAAVPPERISVYKNKTDDYIFNNLDISKINQL